MRAAIVQRKKNDTMKKKKQSTSLMDQGLFWSQIRKYQLTKTYRDMTAGTIQKKTRKIKNKKKRRERVPDNRKMNGGGGGILYWDKFSSYSILN